MDETKIISIKKISLTIFIPLSQVFSAPYSTISLGNKENDLVLGTGSSTKDEPIVYKEGSNFIIKATTKKISEVEVYDTSGRLMIKLKPNQTEVKIERQTLINSVYVLKINQNGKVTTRKMIR